MAKKEGIVTPEGEQTDVTGSEGKDDTDTGGDDTQSPPPNTPGSDSDDRVAKAEADAAKAKDEAKALRKRNKELEDAAKKLDGEVTIAERSGREQLRRQSKVKIVISSGRTPSEQAPVMVACNGHEYLIVRDKEVEVPIGILNVLRLAQESVPSYDSHGRVTAWKQAMRHNVRVIGEEG